MYSDQYLYESDYEAALIASISTIISNGDINSLYSIADLVSDQGRRIINAKYPQLAKTLFSEFRLPNNTNSSEYAALGEKMIACVKRIAGENWLMVPTFYGQAVNVSLGADISADTQTILSYYIDVLDQNPDTKAYATQLVTLLVSANFADTTPARDVFLRHFPHAVTF